MHTLITLPLSAIDASALPRDRTALDPAALADLQSSIAASGLRMPVEVWQLSTPRDNPDPDAPPFTHGLISGFRRLTAARNLARLRADPAPTIPAFLRSPESLPHALSLMVEENEARSPLSPWDRARILVETTHHDHFPTVDAAIATLHPHATCSARSRLRAVAHVVQQLDGILTDPHHYSLRQLLRLHAALRPDFADLIVTALTEHHDQRPEAQWTLLSPILDEAEAALRDPAPNPRPDRPRRLIRPRPGLTVRRERYPNGWSLHFTGADAKGMLMESLMDEIERLVGS